MLYVRAGKALSWSPPAPLLARRTFEGSGAGAFYVEFMCAIMTVWRVEVPCLSLVGVDVYFTDLTRVVWWFGEVWPA